MNELSNINGLKTLLKQMEIVKRSINKELPVPFDDYFNKLCHAKSTRSNI